MRHRIIAILIALTIALGGIAVQADHASAGKGWAKNCLTAIWC